MPDSAEAAASTALERPDYGANGLAGVLPAVASGLGVPGPSGVPAVAVTSAGSARRAVVVLVDGLGWELLRRRAGHAPYLRSLLSTGRPLAAGYPTTTATSMGTFGTGLPPGAHGLVGYESLDPQTDRVFNELSWQDGPVPEHWQPHETIFERAQAHGVCAIRIGPGHFDGSGLTRAALRGGRFVAADALAARVDAALEALRAFPRALVYLYWGDLDTVGHVHGCGSWQWGDELAAIDAELARLARGLPRDTSLTITADHGMVDVPQDRRVDLAHEPDLLEGVRHVAGEPRALQLHCVSGAAEDVAARWRDRLGVTADVRGLDEAVRAGWVGAVEDQVRARLPQVLVTMTEPVAVVDSTRMRPQLLALKALHGALTRDEVSIPLLHQPAAVGG